MGEGAVLERGGTRLLFKWGEGKGDTHAPGVTLGSRVTLMGGGTGGPENRGPPPPSLPPGYPPTLKRSLAGTVGGGRGRGGQGRGRLWYNPNQTHQ